MILQIATRSGLTPRKIANTWLPDELADAEVLAHLEGWGQEKRRLAAMMAHVENLANIANYLRAGCKDAQPPKMLSEEHYLPKRVKRKKVRRQQVKDREQNYQKLSSIMNSLCGFG